MEYESGPLRTSGMDAAPSHAPHLRRKLIMVLTVKFCALLLLWWLFFSEAPAEGEVAAQVTAAMLGAGRGQ